MYSYFKTNIKFPIPALVHATFDLTSDRNRLLPENEFNKGVKDALKDFLIEVSEILANQGNTSYGALKLLSVENNDILTQVELVEEIKKSGKKIFPTITNDYISYKDSPIFLQYDYANLIDDGEKSNFKTLLKFSDDPSIVNILRKMSVVKTPNDEIITNMSQLVLTTKNRAQLIYLLSQEKCEENAQKCLVQMLIDTNDEPAAQGDVVFLPPADGKSLVIPSEFPLKIMNEDLYKELRSLLNESNAEVVASKMELFGVKVYRFADIISLLVRKNAASKFNKDIVLKLYDIYIKNKDTGGDITIPSQQNIFVLNRKGENVKTSEVYLGKDYGNDLCERLFQYDESKFISSPDNLGLVGKNSVNDFLMWLGVADKPRHIGKTLDGDDRKNYGNYVLDHYPFSEKNLGEYRKKEEFKKEYEINSVIVTSIEGLEVILDKCSNEDILKWLLTDEIFIKNTETKKDSKTVFHKYWSKSNPVVCNEDMPSYLLWKLSRIKWMETKSNSKVEPCRCCISKSITEDFSPLIEVPRIDYSSLNSYDKHDIELVLHKIGVKTEIKDFSQQEIYSILNRLSDIDNGNKKARLLYRELVENLDEDDIDESLPERKDFIEKGKVFCKQDNQDSFESVKNVYYLQDRIYGENIIKQFKTIAIDRRRNSTVVKRLFGVEPLANLKFSLNKNPMMNEHLNAELKQELQNLTPYVYALRSSNSKDVYFSRLADKWAIKVCSEISPFYKKKDDDKENGFVLNDYEFVYVSENNTYYVLLKNKGDFTLSQLKSDYKFVDIISEIYSNILKVDSIRPLISRLFEADTKKRDHILKTEIDDSETKLKEAQRQLNIVSDQKVLFWLGILDTINRGVDYKEYEKTELENLVFEKTGIQIDDYSIDYDELSSENCNFREIKNLFNKLDIDIASFNNHSFCKLNLVPYLKKSLTKIKNDKESIFENLLYEQLNKKTIEEKMTFISKIKEYSAFCDYRVDNIINIDLNSILNTIILDKFNIDLAKPGLFEINGLYKRNYGDLTKESELNCEEFMDFLNNSDDNRSLVYFGEYDTIKNNYKRYKENIKAEDKTLFNGFQINDNNLSDAYKSLIEQQDLLKDLEIQGIETEKTPSNNHNRHGQHGGQRKPPKNISEKRKKRIGFVGEVIVYEQLKKIYGEASVSWDSGYAKEANVNPKGDDMYHYDIKYKKNDDYYYVEVKSTTTDSLEFEISELEFEFGKINKKNYEIFIVTNVEDKNRKIKNIGNPFVFEDGESLMNCQRFTLLNDTFTIKMKEKK